MTSLRDLMSLRRTVRRLRAEDVPDALVDALLDAALAAPSAHNRQPWRYVLVRTVAGRRALAEAMGARFRTDLARDGLAPEEVRRRVDDSIHRISAAPLVIIACMTRADMDRYPDASRQEAERIMGVQSVAASIQNLLLAAHELGLGAGWMCAPLFCQDVVRASLDLPADWEPQALITVGWPAETPSRPAQRDRADLIVER